MTRDKTRRMTIRVIESLPGPLEDAKTSNIEYSVAQESNLCLAVYKNGSRSPSDWDQLQTEAKASAGLPQELIEK